MDVSDTDPNLGDDLNGLDGANVESVSLRGKFLLAAPSLEDPNFVRAIVLIVRHDEDGALGLVVNRPLGVTLGDACGDDVEAAKGVDVPLFLGGPCQGPLVAVHNLEPLAIAEAELNSEVDEDGEGHAQAVAPDVWFCSRREALEALMRHVAVALDEAEPLKSISVKFIAGYAGWGTGQLEVELAEGAWQLLDAAAADVYSGGDPNHPAPPPTTALPAGAASLLGLLAATSENGISTDGFVSGVRQWVRLNTRVNLSRVIDPRRIPPDPSVN